MTGVLVSRTSARLAATTVAVAAVLAAALPAPAAAGAAGRPRPPIPPSQRVSGGGTAAGASLLARAAAGNVRLAVTFTPGADAEPALAEARAAGGVVARRIPQLGVVTIEVPQAAATRVTAALARRAGVRDVSPVRTRAVAYSPNDTDFATAQGYLAEVGAPAAWDVTKGSADALIAVVDSGVDVTHPELAGKVAGSHNAVTGTADVTDAVGHGTFVAGVAAAATDNEAGIAGAGFNSKLLAVKVTDDTGVATGDAVAAGIVWAADNGADVVNLSVRGVAPDAAEQAAVSYALGKGVVVVGSAGNDALTSASYPAAYQGVVAVGATSGTGRATFSNYGSWVDVGAPGTGIRSTTPAAGSTLFTANYAVGEGTSFAAALVSGQAALLRSIDPAHSGADIAAAITESAGAATYGFAHGRVDFAGSLDRLPPTSVPTLVAPVADATVAGAVTVTATSTAPRVRFTTPAGTATVAVADGVATTTFPTYGLAGAQTVHAADCTAYKCATAQAARSVVVDNGVPTVTGPAPGSAVNTASFTATATTPDSGGGVRFLVDGEPAGFDGAAPFSAAIGTSALTEGAHQLTAVICNADGSTCDTAHPSAAVSFTVATLHPAVTGISPAAFSPNGDGRSDTTTATYTLDVAQAVVLRVRNAAGTVVRGPHSLGTQSGTRTWVWNGRVNGGAVAPDGTYRVEIATSKDTANGTLTGLASRTVRVDKVAPGLASVSGSGTTFYPYKDAYKDTFAPAVTLGESGRLFLNVYNSAGTRVRRIDTGVRAPGRHPIGWNGRRADGTQVPAGTYKYAFEATDSAFNTRTTGRYTVYVSAKKLVGKAASRVLSPMASKVDHYIGRCSEMSTPAIKTDWSGSIGYLSDYHGCSYYELDDFVASIHGFTLPAAIKYGSVRVLGTGKEALPGYGDTAQLGYLDAGANTTGHGVSLGAAYGTYAGPSVAAGTLLSGRRLQWFVGTMYGNWYSLRSFTVKWTYYVLA